MPSNKRSCSGWRLYVILDAQALGPRDPLEVAAAAIRGGADALQWRDKSASARELLAQARRLVPAARAAKVPLIINDRPDVALAAGADGVHLGQDDLPVPEARAILGERLIGCSTHSLAQAQAAQADGADYIGFGPVYPTPTKPDYGSVGLDAVRTVCGRVRVPVVCIGGIDAGSVDAVLERGARCVAVVRAVCAADDPESAARALAQRLGRDATRNRAAAGRSL
jgi:thiamine-phosphate pyrophosphorylase